MKKLSILAVLSFLFLSQTQAEHHESLGSHVHGAIKVDMAVEGKTIDLAIDGPTEAFVGFEHAPKSAAEKKSWATAETLWTKELITKLFILDKSLDCKVVEATFLQEIEENHEKKSTKKESGVHSDIAAAAKISCAKDLAGQNLIVALKKHYPNIKKLAVDLASTQTKTIEIKDSSQTIKL